MSNAPLKNSPDYGKGATGDMGTSKRVANGSGKPEAAGSPFNAYPKSNPTTNMRKVADAADGIGAGVDRHKK